MLYADAVRGWDATGVFGVTKVGNVDIKKQAEAAGHFIMTPEFEKFKTRGFQEYQMMVGHNRKATHGKKTHKEAHPFWDKDEKICLIHNGMIQNHKEFCATSTVDSEAIANALATTDTAEVIEKIEGAFAFIWFNTEERKLYFIRNSQRPLYILENNTTFIIASEDSLVYWVAKRNNAPITSCSEAKINTLYSLSLIDRKVVEEKEINQKKAVSTITHISPITTIPRGGHTDISKYTVPEEIPETFYYTTSHVGTIETFTTKIKKNARILVEAISYDVSKHGITLTLSMLNVKAPFLRIKMFVTKQLFDLLDITEVLSVTVLNIHINKGEVLVYVNDPDEEFSITSLNNTTIANNVWYDERFPLTCAICNDTVKWNDMPKSEIVLDPASTILICPTCVTKEQQTCIND